MTKLIKPTVGELLQWAISYFKDQQTNLPSHHQPRLEAELLLAHQLQVSRTKLHVDSDQQVENQATITGYQEAIAKRAQGYPFQYLTGVQNFMALDFCVEEGVLIPRGDTEVLVEEALELAQAQLPPGESLLLGDVCTGSGAIGLSLAHYLPQAQVVLSDISPVAIQVASKNARQLDVVDRVTVVQGDLLEPMTRWKFHMLTANPPYISPTGWGELEDSVRNFEPSLALVGGEDGLDFYRRLIDQAPDLIYPGGYLLMEMGYDQGPAVAELVSKNNYYSRHYLLQDYGGRDRVIVAQISSSENFFPILQKHILLPKHQ